MKKILLSMIMLCTAMSAWSYKEETVTISCNGTNTSPFTVDATTASDGRDADPYWQVDDYNTLVLKAPTSYYVTKVEFATMSGKVDYCDKFTKYQLNVWVSPNKEVLQYYDVITFSNPEGSIAKVTSMTVTYHRCSGTHQEAVPGTCTTKGRAEYWECECGKIYIDADCAHETNMALLAKDFDPTNHPDALEEHARTEATCIKAGNEHYWYCKHCKKNFGSKDGKGEAITNVVIPIDPTAHPEALEEHAGVEPTCTTAGNMHYWHCSHCNKDFGNEGGTGEAITDVTIPAINHKNKKSTEAVAPTTETKGNVAYWYCPDCDKHFGDEGCTKELTEWILEKLMNMMHLDFAGTSVPIEAEHYLNTTKLNFTDDGDIILTVNGKSVAYGKGMIDKFTLSNGTPTAQISANEDPDNKGTYYSTFYSSLESYAVPEGFTAYRGEISSDGTKLSLTSVGDGVMTRGKGYILKGTTSSDSIKVTANVGSSTDNELLGTDVAIASLGANDYALSHGSNGVGFYLWSGKNIGANKAYLKLPASSVKAFTFEFEEATGIHNSQFIIHNSENDAMYNLNGVRVDENYKGIVIKNGKKVYQR